MDELEFFVEEQMLAQPAPDDQGERTFNDDLYKKWFRTGSKAGFLAIRPWLEAGRVSVDIGETGEGGLKGHTQVWTNAIELATYLGAVYDGVAERLYPANPRLGVPTPEGYVSYGGVRGEGGPISRVLKIHHWQMSGNDTAYDDSSFVWKCGHFRARETDSGAFIPDMKAPLSVNLIKISRVEMAQIAYRMNLAISAFVATAESDPFRSLNGNNR